MKYFIYTRKSTESEDRQVMSIESQLAELKEFAAKEKLEIVASYSEAQTAKEPGRKVFGEMLERICAGEASGILAWHPDRLARNSIDGGKIIYLLDTGRLADLKFPTFWFDSTPQGKFMLNIAFGQSKYYVDNLSENIRRGIRQKLRKGIWPAFAPLGYLNDPKTKMLVIDSMRAPLIRKMFELYANGEYTLLALTNYLAKAGLRSYRGNVLSVSCVQRLLQHKIYYGVFEYAGELHQGTHEPIISKKLFDQVQLVMANRGKKKRKRKHEFAFSGFAYCGNCGCLITAEKQKGYIYYRCTKKKQTCNEKYLREEVLVEQMKNVLQKVSVPKSWADKMLAGLECEKEAIRQESLAFVQNLQAQAIELERKMERLLDIYIDGGGISPEDYQAKKTKLLNKKLEIEQQIKDFEQSGNNWLEPVRQNILQSSQAKIVSLSSDKNQIREFLKNVGSNFKIHAKRLDFTPLAGWRARAAGEPFPDWRNRRVWNFLLCF